MLAHCHSAYLAAAFTVRPLSGPALLTVSAASLALVAASILAASELALALGACSMVPTASHDRCPQAFEYSARHGLGKRQFDITWLFIRAFEKLGLVSNVKLPTDAAKRRLAL